LFRQKRQGKKSEKMINKALKMKRKRKKERKRKEGEKEKKSSRERKKAEIAKEKLAR